jgi:hypothetical protein
MKKYYVILAIVIVAIVSSSIIAVSAFLWNDEQPVQQAMHVYHKGDQVPDTVFTFDGFTNQYPPVGTPPMGSSPLPTCSPTLMLCVVFKLNDAGASANQSPGIHISYPTQEVISVNRNGNTTTDLGDKLDNQFYTIVAYNVNAQTVTMIYD